MWPDDLDEISRLRWELEITRIKYQYDKELDGSRKELQFLNEKHGEKIQELDKTRRDLSILRRDLDSEREKLSRTEKELVTARERLRQVDSELSQKNKRAANRSKSARGLGILTSLLFLLSSVLAGIGTNIITSKSDNTPIGQIMLALAFVTYIIATIITTIFFTTEGNRN